MSLCTVKDNSLQMAVGFLVMFGMVFVFAICIFLKDLYAKIKKRWWFLQKNRIVLFFLTISGIVKNSLRQYQEA